MNAASLIAIALLIASAPLALAPGQAPCLDCVTPSMWPSESHSPGSVTTASVAKSFPSHPATNPSSTNPQSDPLSGHKASSTAATEHSSSPDEAPWAVLDGLDAVTPPSGVVPLGPRPGGEANVIPNELETQAKGPLFI